MIVAYQGVPGAFGHQAAHLAFPDAEPVACVSFAAVAALVSEGQADVGVLPVENHYAGPVPTVAPVIAESGLFVERLFDLPVRMHLLGLPGATIDKLKSVASHPVALEQCWRNLTPLRLEYVEVPNTAMAAKSLSDPTSAALASEMAAGIYGLQILRRDMHDDPDNRTTFAVVRRH